MEVLFTKINQSITPHFVEEVSNLLMIEEEALNEMTHTIITGLFIAFLKKGDTFETENSLSEFTHNVDDNREISVYSFEGGLSDEQIIASTIWSEFIFTSKRNEFISFISTTTSVDKDQIEMLVTTLTYTVALSFGRKLENRECTIGGLLAQVYAEKDLFSNYASRELLSTFGIPSLLNIGQNLSSDARVASHMIYVEIQELSTNEVEEEEEKSTWWKWFSSKAAL